jgi:hypothetical protein
VSKKVIQKIEANPGMGYYSVKDNTGILWPLSGFGYCNFLKLEL